MREHAIRHLPVFEAGKLIGIVSERDLAMIETLRSVNLDELTVEEAMVQDVYAVPADAPVDEVVEQMASRKLGSTIALDRQGRVSGIFTTVDALQFYADLLRRVTA
jgi:acetoin utilization protein AcuB